MFAFLHAATAVKFRRTSCAAIVRRRSTADSVTPQLTALPLLRSGLDLSSARTSAVVSMIAASMLANKRVTGRTPTQPIVHGPRMLLLIVLVARRVCQKFRMLVERLAKILYRTVPSLATTPLTAVTSASSRVIRASAGLAWRQSPLHADADAIRSLRSVIREPRRLHSVCVSAVLHSTVVDTSVVSIVALASAKQPSDRQPEGSHALWTQQLDDLETTLRQSTFARALAVAS